MLIPENALEGRLPWKPECQALCLVHPLLALGKASWPFDTSALHTGMRIGMNRLPGESC